MGRYIPKRMCLGCREMKLKNELIRVVRNEEGVLEIDPTGKKNGRGAYLCRNSECLTKVIKNKSFSKALGSEPNADMFEMLKKSWYIIE